MYIFLWWENNELCRARSKFDKKLTKNRNKYAEPNMFFFRKINSIIFERFWAANYDCVLEIFPARQDFEIIGLSSVKKMVFTAIIYKSSDLGVQKLRRRDLSVDASFGEILNFLRSKNDVKYHWSMPWNLLCDLNLKVFMQFTKKCMKAFKFKSHVNFMACFSEMYVIFWSLKIENFYKTSFHRRISFYKFLNLTIWPIN
jgi:hypothetical protein